MSTPQPLPAVFNTYEASLALGVGWVLIEMFITARNYYGLIDLTLDVVHGDIPRAMLGWLAMGIFIVPVGYCQPLSRQGLALALFAAPFFISRRFIKNRKWLVIFCLAVWAEMLAGITGGFLIDTIFRHLGFEG